MRRPVTTSALYVVDREPRPPRELTPRPPRRGELAAALILCWVAAHLLLAQLTLLLAIAFGLVSRATRWRPEWLVLPAATGLVWLLAIGPRAALAGFTAGPRQVLGYLTGAAAGPARLLHLTSGYAGLASWLPGQASLALIAAAAEVAAACWLRRWHLRCHHGGDRAAPPFRPGLVALARRQFTAWSVKTGGVAGRAGAVLGVDWPSGQPAEVPWRAAEGGVLVAGSAAGEVAAAGFRFVHAAIRRRKPVLVVDLDGTPGLAGELASICADVAAPLHVFGAGGPGCYDPLRGGHPARNAALLRGMIDWARVNGPARRTGAGYLDDLCAVLAAAPGDPRIPVLDDVIQLLSPGALWARLRQAPPRHPGRTQLAQRVAASARLLTADPATAGLLASELAGLRASPLGRWLRPAAAAGEEQISLTAVVRDRAVLLFSLRQPGPGHAAQMIANLVALDLLAVFADSARAGIDGDGLAWFGRGDVLAGPALAGLLRTGAQAGLATVLGTRSAAVAGEVAGLANVLIVQHPGLAAQLDLPSPVRRDQFVLAVRAPGQLRADCRFVAGRVP
jgi:hypothetical protein